jgi:hypothetical protein
MPQPPAPPKHGTHTGDHCASDTAGSQIVFFGSLATDTDNPLVKADVLAAFAPLRKLAGAPQTIDALRWLDLSILLRGGKGEPAEWPLALRSIKSPMALGAPLGEADPHLKPFIDQGPDRVELAEARELLKAAERP